MCALDPVVSWATFFYFISLIRNMDLSSPRLQISDARNGDVVPLGALQEIWTEAALNSIVGGEALSVQDVLVARRDLIRTISLLCFIGASDLGANMRYWIKHGVQWDAELSMMTEDQLCQLTDDRENLQFLIAARRYFTATIIKEGECKPLRGIEALPLVGEPQKMGLSASSIDHAQKIAKGHFIPWGVG